MPPCFLGIDVGTGSARAGLFSPAGRMLGQAAAPIQTWHPAPDFVEQSSEDIWRAVCRVAREAVRQAGVDPTDVRGIGMDATCSLVVLDADDRPVTVSPGGRDEQNVVVWMDHRALDQTARINRTRDEVLRYVGGIISPEMETPKLLWLKENLPATWSRARRLLDLPDFLTYRATGDDTRSLCSTVCKWTYLGHQAPDGDARRGWSENFFRTVGLGDLTEDGFARIGQRVRPLGEPLGRGLTAAAAQELGLAPGTAVGVSIIDAHAGGLGVLGTALAAAEDVTALERSLALIGGTSSCHMAASAEARFIPGIWGPYFSAMIPGRWLTEAGQSATGALIDHVIQVHAAGAVAREEARAQGVSVYEWLNQRLEALGESAGGTTRLTRGFHLLPDFHGNRSPWADPHLRGMIAGLRLGHAVDDLALEYLAAIQAIAHGTRLIVETMNAAGYRIDTLYACGGGTKNPVFLREHADVTGCRLVLPREPEAVLLGSAMLGAVAAREFGDVPAAMAAMGGEGKAYEPAGGETADYHARKYRVFLRMHDDQLAYRELMGTGAASPEG